MKEFFLRVPCYQGNEDNKVFSIDLLPGTKMVPLEFEVSGCYEDAVVFKVLKKGPLTEEEGRLLQTAGIEIFSLFIADMEVILAVEKMA